MTFDIVTITLNPAVDKNFYVERLVPDHKLRTANPDIDAGGGGINVSKGIKRLGGNSLAVFPAGGSNGKRIIKLLGDEGIECSPIAIEQETRESLMITESTTNKQFRIVAEGPTLSNKEVEQVLDVIKKISPKYIVASGSLGKGLEEDVYARFAKLAKETNSRFILDTSGDALKEAANEGVFLVKPNLNELSKLAGVEELELDLVDEAAMEVIEKGNCEIILVSMGASGAILVTKKGYKRIPAPTIKRKSTVGAGDSVVAGMIWALQNGDSIEEAAYWGVACGTAATMNEGTQLFRKEDASKLYNWIKSKV